VISQAKHFSNAKNPKLLTLLRGPGKRFFVHADKKVAGFLELEWRFGSLRNSYSKRLIALIPIRIAGAAIFASSDVVAGVVF
jgi:hypothetical protein